MITYDEVKTKIAASGWDPQAVDTIDPALPKLGQFSLNFVNNYSSDISGQFTITFAQSVAQIPQWQSFIESGDENGFTSALVEILRSGNLATINLASSFITDVHNNKALSAKINPHFSRSLFLFQMRQMEDLPFAEVVMALSLHPVDLVMIFDLEEELKRYAYYKNYDPDEKPLALFRTALENSEEEVAGTNINKLIEDFHEYAAALRAKNSTYAVAQYLTASPTARAFSKSDATVLSRVLRAHTWLLEGRYAEKEVLQYESGRDVIIEKLPDLIISPPTEAIGSYEVEVAPPEVYPESGIFSEQVEGTVQHIAASQKKIIEDIAAKAPTSIRYNDNASVRDLIEHKRSSPIRGGLVLEQETNIKVDELAKGVKDRQRRSDDIQTKLDDLRKRKPNA